MKKRRVFFGSLEEQERVRLQAAEERDNRTAAGGNSSSEESSDDDAEDVDISVKRKRLTKETDGGEKQEEEEESAIDRAIKAGNVNIDEGDTLEMPQDATNERHQELLAEFERRKKVKAIAVPTDDPTVKARLRELGHPICLFGEGPAQRRDRLRELLSVFEQLIPGFSRQAEEVDSSEVEKKKAVKEEIWYHEGPPELKAARCFIADFSLPRAQERLAKAKIAFQQPESEKAILTQEIHRKSRTLINFCSQIGDNRPLSSCQFSPNGKVLATSSWSGLCKLWSVPDGEAVRTLRGHNERVGCITFHPEATLNLSPSVANMVSCAADGSVLLWNLEDDTPMGNIEGHEERVASVAYHPSGRFLATACFDKSWRLWDLELQKEVLHQEGHSRECYRVCFQKDGALAASCGFDARGLVWDLRTGRNIIQLDGHLKKVLAIDFSPNGYQVATGSEDQKVIIWDLRQRRQSYTIPAHSNIVSHAKFTEGSLVTASFDGLAKIWSAPTWAPLKTMAGHEQKVTCVDATRDGTYMVTTSFDRTFKLWGPEYLV